MRSFRVIEFQLLQSCNAGCLYCAYEQGLPHHADFLPLELIEQTLAAEKPEWVWFEGGEVTISEKSLNYLLKAMEIAGKYGVKNRINTNAQNLDPVWSRRLAGAGLRFACVSFDSLEPECYGKLRGYPSPESARRLDELKANIEGLCDTGITVDVEATVTRYNIGEFCALYDYVEGLASPERDVMMGVQFLVATSDQLLNLYPGIETMRVALEGLLVKAKQGKIPVRICCSPLVPCQHPALYKPHPHVLWVGCSCGYDYVHIHANGDVLLCGFWDHSKPIGNLYRNSLGKIWQMNDLRRQAMQTIPGACAGCTFWEGDYRCHNTCFSVSHRKTGTFRNQSYALLSRMVCNNEGIKV